MPLTLFHLQTCDVPLKERFRGSMSDLEQPPIVDRPRRSALVPETKEFFGSLSDSDLNVNKDNVIIVPHMKITPGDLHLFNRAMTSGNGLLSGSTAGNVFSQTIENDKTTPKSPWVFKKLHEWSHRAKSREIVKHTKAALIRCDSEYQDTTLLNLLEHCSWQDMWPNQMAENPVEQKRRQAVWELFHSELVFLYKQLLVLRNVFKEPLKMCQVEGCLLFVEPDLLFGNLEELCQVSFAYCLEFLRQLNLSEFSGRLACTDTVISVFNKFSQGNACIAAFQAYCINYKATMEYLESIRKGDDRFIEFEKVCSTDKRANKLQLEDLLISPLHRITRLPILLKNIHKNTHNRFEKEQLDLIIVKLNDSLRSIDDSIQWLHNFERLQEIQRSLIWPSISETEPKTYIPEFLKLALGRQFCESLVAHPRRKLIDEGALHFYDQGKVCETYVFLFNDMLLLTKLKRSRARGSSASMTCKDNYVVIRQPVPLDSCVFCDVGPQDALVSQLKHAFVILHLTRFYQVVAVYTLMAPTKESKESWINKFQESIESYESIQLKDMLKGRPLMGGSHILGGLRPHEDNNTRRPSREIGPVLCVQHKPQDGGVQVITVQTKDEDEDFPVSPFSPLNTNQMQQQWSFNC